MIKSKKLSTKLFRLCSDESIISHRMILNRYSLFCVYLETVVTPSIHAISRHGARFMVVITIFGITFLGIFLLCCSLFFNRVISIALSSILVVTSSLVVNLGDLMQKKLATISPIAWMRVADSDVNRFGVEISPSLSFIIWGYLILIGGLVGIICRRANNIDLIWEEYE